MMSKSKKMAPKRRVLLSTRKFLSLRSEKLKGCALVLLVAFATAATPKFTVCGGSWQNVQIQATNNWKGGSKATFSITATVPTTVEPGYHIYTKVKVFGDDYENKDDDMCSYEGTPFQCPIAPGTYTWNFGIDLPEVPFTVPLSSDSEFRHPSTGNLLLCTKMEVDVD